MQYHLTSKCHIDAVWSNGGGLVPCNNMIFAANEMRNGVAEGRSVLRCRSKEKKTGAPLTKSRQSRESIFLVGKLSAEVPHREGKFSFEALDRIDGDSPARLCRL
jgi:hypothetical protein